VGGFFILGSPTETREEILRTVDFANRLPLDLVSFLAATAFPGTTLFEQLDHDVQEKLRSLPPQNFSFHHTSISLCLVSADELKNLIRLAYFKFYFNFRRIYSLCRKVKIWNLIKNFLLISYFIISPRSQLFYKWKLMKSKSP